MLEVRALNAWYGQAQVLFDLNFRLERGEMVLLQGLNGAGKSSLLQALMGLGPRVQGSICYAGQELGGLAPFERAAHGLGFVPEDRRLFTELTVLQNLQLAALTGSRQLVRPRVAERFADRLEATLALFAPLKPLLARTSLTLSGGEQQMLSLARTLMTNPDMLLLDEPCEGVAPQLVESILRALQSLQKAGLTLLVAEQSENFSVRTDRVITLVAGHIALALES